MKDVRSAELPGLPNRTLLQNTVPTGKCIKQMKKKLSNYPMMKMQLSSNIFMAASLRVRKKKHKRNKKCLSETGHVSEKNVVDVNSIPSDLQPSTCKGSRPFGNIAISQRKGKKAWLKKNKKSEVNNLVLNSNGNVETSVNHGEVVTGVGQNCDMLTHQSLKSCKTGSGASQWNVKGNNNSDAKQWDVRGNNSEDSRKESMQNGLMGMLTRGLKETIGEYLGM